MDGQKQSSCCMVYPDLKMHFNAGPDLIAYSKWRSGGHVFCEICLVKMHRRDVILYALNPSPSPRKASRSNPRRLFLYCIQNDVTLIPLN